ncbi:hypothetical protein BDZ97DRAFT_2073598 [Flammula alnicola]|nr:hypothetical protein BDZ97DRAFT_2073598 [Flammula alnicola]
MGGWNSGASLSELLWSNTGNELTQPLDIPRTRFQLWRHCLSSLLTTPAQSIVDAKATQAERGDVSVHVCPRRYPQSTMDAQSPSTAHQLPRSNNNTTTTAGPVTRTTAGEDDRRTARMTTSELRTRRSGCMASTTTHDDTTMPQVQHHRGTLVPRPNLRQQQRTPQLVPFNISAHLVDHSWVYDIAPPPPPMNPHAHPRVYTQGATYKRAAIAKPECNDDPANTPRSVQPHPLITTSDSLATYCPPSPCFRPYPAHLSRYPLHCPRLAQVIRAPLPPKTRPTAIVSHNRSCTSIAKRDRTNARSVSGSNNEDRHDDVPITPYRPLDTPKRDEKPSLPRRNGWRRDQPRRMGPPTKQLVEAVSPTTRRKPATSRHNLRLRILAASNVPTLSLVLAVGGYTSVLAVAIAGELARAEEGSGSFESRWRQSVSRRRQDLSASQCEASFGRFWRSEGGQSTMDGWQAGMVLEMASRTSKPDDVLLHLRHYEDQHRDRLSAKTPLVTAFQPLPLLRIDFLVSLLKKNWQNIKSLHIKSMVGKPICLFA